MYVKVNSIKDFIQEVGIDLNYYDFKTLCEGLETLANYRQMGIYDIYREYETHESSEDGKLEAKIFRTESPELMQQYYSSVQFS